MSTIIYLGKSRKLLLTSDFNEKVHINQNFDVPIRTFHPIIFLMDEP